MTDVPAAEIASRAAFEMRLYLLSVPPSSLHFLLTLLESMYALGYGLQEREKTFKDATTHISNIGEMVEDMEGRMRDALYEVVAIALPRYPVGEVLVSVVR